MYTFSRVGCDIMLKKIKCQNNFLLLINIIFSLLATFGIFYILDTSFSMYKLSNSFLTIIVSYLFFVVYKNLKAVNKSEKILVIIFSLILAVAFTIGFQLEYFSNIDWHYSTIFKIFFMYFSIYPLINNIVGYISNYKGNINSKKKIAKKNIIIFLIILFFNLLSFLALYPGIYTFDNFYMLSPYFLDGFYVSSHYSIPFSYIIYFIMNLGNIFFKSYQIGFAIYIFLQNIFLSYVLTKIVVYSYKRTNNIYILIFSILFFCLFPWCTIMVNSCTSDIVFSAFFALYILKLLELVENDGHYKNKKEKIIFPILILILCFVRNNGFYCILFSFVFAFVILKKRRIFLTFVFVIPLIIFKVYSGPLLDILKIENGSGINEMSSAFDFQLARVYTYNIKSFSNSELKKLNYFYNDLEKNFKYYKTRPSMSDKYKNSLIGERVLQQKKEFIKLYVNIGLKDPKNYIEAFLLGNLGLWYPNKNYYDSRVFLQFVEYNMPYDDVIKYTKLHKDSKLVLYNAFLKKLCLDSSWADIPVISSFFSLGIYFWFLLLSIGVIIIKKKWKLLIPLSSIFGLTLTIVFAPVIVLRYLFPVIITVPILLSLIFSINTIKN